MTAIYTALLDIWTKAVASILSDGDSSIKRSTIITAAVATAVVVGIATYALKG